MFKPTVIHCELTSEGYSSVEYFMYINEKTTRTTEILLDKNLATHMKSLEAFHWPDKVVIDEK